MLKWMERSHGIEKALTALLKYVRPLPRLDSQLLGSQSVACPPVRETEYSYLWEVRCSHKCCSALGSQPDAHRMVSSFISSPPNLLRPPRNVPGSHLEGDILSRGALLIYAQHQKQLGNWGGLHEPFSCRCGAEDHVEAVKKLQNSSKLLQKVIYPWRVERAWTLPEQAPRLSPSPDRMCIVSAVRGRGRRQCSLWLPFPRRMTE